LPTDLKAAMVNGTLSGHQFMGAMI